MANSSALGNKKYFLILGDIVILYFSLLVTLLIRYQAEYSSSIWIQHLAPFSIVFLIFITTFFIDDLYELAFNITRSNLFGKILKNVIIAVVISFGFFYLGQNRLFTIRPQRVLLINAGIFTILTYAWHILFISMTKSSKIANNLLIVGQGKLVDEITRKINSSPQFGFKVKAQVKDQGEYANLKKICESQKIHTIVSTVHPRENATLSKSLFECLPLKISFFDSANFYEKIMGKVPITTIEQVWFLENLSESNKNLYEILKRAFDIILSIILLIITIIFFPLIALAIKLSSKGPIFFIQTRTGKQGKNFKTIKFRTMVADAEKNGAQWASKNDPRITPLGRFMRKTRIDELPQLINVIVGDMSLIGPRPERPEFIEKLEQQIPFYKERLLVRPGLSGWAQVFGPAYGGSKKETLEKLQYDLYYIKNRSLGLDLGIALRTIKTILTRKGQ